MDIFLHERPKIHTSEYCVIKSINSSWNDFGFKSKVQLEINILNQSLVLQAYYTFYSNQRYHTLASSKENTSLQETQYYILLASINEYKKLAKTFPSRFDEILKDLNDISFLRMQRKQPRQFHSLLQSEIFNKSFIRENDSFQAYLYGYKGTDLDLTTDITKIIAENPLMKKEIIFEINKNNSDFNFLPYRHFVLIGRNGTGKSQTLRKLTQKYSNRNDFSAVICFSQSDKSNSFSKRIKNIRHINLTKSKKNIEILQLMIRMKYGSASYESSNLEILVDLVKNVSFIENLVIYKDKSTYISLNELINFNSGEQKTLEKIQEIITYNQFKIKKESNFYELSSGENFFINLIFNLIDNVNQYKSNILFIFDEPESFLHPNFISIFSEIICYFTNRLYCTAVTATHSIYLVKNSIQQNIAIFRKNKTSIEIERPSFNTFGANLNSLSHFIFGFESPLEHEDRVIRQILELESEKNLSFEELINKYGKFLSSETLDRVYTRLSNEFF
ncbi:hypothetical protein L292_0239 [Acinetobacter junii CIP 107470 = MTCC 11364]|uniref:ATPase AAA-type core domain-containing protein n=3 Tax=Acinetobacter junii TaxID=40215 RepID=S7Y877_ACIJU|nr:AAA family ATPase [Acinetobacter junii]ENV51956.1 hypothetical protein F953_00585 [Acinetobacter junii CIP 107470 = MTCC 11364]EPR84188.1 hypothetical protein L292_0239 [Acinetobacter junii CIP 107470 = MTCC 11364]MDH1917018.1 ATP-binding protein [Acinetobacter junii]